MYMPGFNSNNTTTSCVSDKPNGVDEPVISVILRTVLISLILFLSFFGNVLVFRGATRMPNRPFAYNLISNLALAEIVLTVSYPFIFHYTSKPWSWVFGGFMCKLVNPLVMCSTLVVTFTLAVIAVYRCFILVLPRKQRPTKCTARLVILFSWVWGIALSMPASLTRTIVKVKVCGPKILLMCFESFPSQQMRHNYTIALFVLQFVVPFLVMVLSYSTVIVKVKKYVKSTKEEVQLSSHGGKTSSAMESERRQESSGMRHLEAELLKMIYIIILIFFICYLPSHIVFISEELGWFSLNSWKYILNRYTDILHAVPSALHPICYGSMSKILGVNWRCLLKSSR